MEEKKKKKTGRRLLPAEGHMYNKATFSGCDHTIDRPLPKTAAICPSQVCNFPFELVCLAVTISQR